MREKRREESMIRATMTVRTVRGREKKRKEKNDHEKEKITELMQPRTKRKIRNKRKSNQKSKLTSETIVGMSALYRLTPVTR